MKKEEDKWEDEGWRNVDISVVFREELSPAHGFGGRFSMLSKSYVSLFLPFYSCLLFEINK